MTDAAVFGARLGACRRSAGLSQQELAERSGLSTRAISNLERGRTRWPHPDSVHRLAEALELRDQARAQFIAAAGRRLVAAVTSPVNKAPQHRPRLADSGQVVPRQLPAPVRQFVGRESGLTALTGLLDQARTGPAAVVISAVEGTAGIGKTALAVHWAHQVASRFPDGQLYVNLRGFGPSATPLAPAEAIRGFLDALGVAPQRIPAGLDAQAGLYRSVLAGRRMLIVLDNARDVEQVRPLLPGSTGCLVLVTSRARLGGLAVGEGAHLFTLDLLTEDEARQLLAARLGTQRAAAEPGAVDELIALCAGLPLALAIAAARAAGCPGFPLAELAAELRDAAGRLDGLDAGDSASNVRTVFSWSYRSLPEPGARMFRLLGVHPGPDIAVAAAASLAGVPVPAARQTLRELAAAHLLTEHRPGRYALHDLLRAYAAEQAAAIDDDARRHAALGRTLDHYLRTAVAASLLLDPSRELVTLAPPQPGVTPEQLAGRQQAGTWFDTERHVLTSAVTLAAQAGFDACAWQLPWAMANFLDWRGHWDDWAAIQSIALAAATRLGDTAGQAVARRLLAQSCARLADYNQARAHLTECLRLHRQLGDRAGEAHAHQSLSWVSGQQDRHADALDHAERALALHQETGDRAGQASALNNVGCGHAQLGDYQQAQTFCRRARTLYRQLGDRSGEANSWDSLGYAEHQLGNLAEATRCYRRALSIFGELGSRYYQAETLTHLGDTRHAAGDPQQARAAWEQARDILDDLRHPDADKVRSKLRRP